VVRRIEALRAKPVASSCGASGRGAAAQKSIRHQGAVVKLSRRQFIKATAATGAATAVGTGVLGGCSWFGPQPTQNAGRALIAPADTYSSSLVDTIYSGLQQFPEVVFKGKSILLKPNLVETTPDVRPINTNPQVVAAAAEAFRKLGAASIK